MLCGDGAAAVEEVVEVVLYGFALVFVADGFEGCVAVGDGFVYLVEFEGEDWRDHLCPLHGESPSGGLGLPCPASQFLPDACILIRLGTFLSSIIVTLGVSRCLASAVGAGRVVATNFSASALGVVFVHGRSFQAVAMRRLT